MNYFKKYLQPIDIMTTFVLSFQQWSICDLLRVTMEAGSGVPASIIFTTVIPTPTLMLITMNTIRQYDLITASQGHVLYVVDTFVPPTMSCLLRKFLIKKLSMIYINAKTHKSH